MTLSSLATNLSEETIPSKKAPEYRYDVKLEVGEQAGGATIPIVAIFLDLVKRMKAVVGEGNSLVVYTATDKLFSETEEMTSENFQKAFKVDQIESKTPKVMMGFKLHTTTSLYDIKQSLMKTYLVPNKLFMREHVGGFHHGLKKYTFGFLKYDHPDHPDINSLTTRFAKHTTEAWKKMAAKQERNKWKDELPQAFYGDGISIPTTFTKERIGAEAEGKTKILTYGLVVSTPKKYGPLLRTLLDSAIIAKKINNLIPFALQREEPAGYYHLLAEQERFMEQHRNIPILNIPMEAVNRKGLKGVTLDHVLNTNKDIHRVAFDSKNNRYHVSTRAAKYREVHNWISEILEEHQFPFGPTVRTMKYAGSRENAVKYAAVFADAISTANESYDASTIKTTRSTAWKQSPPLDISYVPTAEAFPPLTQKPPSSPATQSTTSETIDESTIQSAISVAIRTIQEQHRSELAELKQEMQRKMESLENQMLELGKHVVQQTYQALVTDDSPLVTKADHLQLQHEMNTITAQLSILIQMVSTSTGLLPTSLESIPTNATSPPRTNKRLKQNRTPEKIPYSRDPLTQDDNSLPSTTSALDERFEECEE